MRRYRLLCKPDPSQRMTHYSQSGSISFEGPALLTDQHHPRNLLPPPSDDLRSRSRFSSTHHFSSELSLRVWQVLLPYLKLKLDKFHTRVRQGHRPEARWLRLITYLYPFLHVSYEGSNLLFQWLYMVGVSPHFSASQRILRQRVVRSSTASSSSGLASSSTQTPQVSKASRAAGYLRAGLIAAVVLYKALEWWHATGAEMSTPTVAKDVPPVPELSPRAAAGVPVPLDPTVCPLCQRLRVNAAASPSGYTFCFKCLAKYVRVHRRCPVTHLPCSESAIRRIYDDDEL